MERQSYNGNLKENAHVDFFFSIFPYFEGIHVIFTKVACLVQVNKHMVMILGFLSSRKCIMIHYNHFKLGEKSLYQLRKNISTYVIWSFA